MSFAVEEGVGIMRILSASAALRTGQRHITLPHFDIYDADFDASCAVACSMCAVYDV